MRIHLEKQPQHLLHNLNIDQKDHAAVPFKLQPPVVCFLSPQLALNKMNPELPGPMGRCVCMAVLVYGNVYDNVYGNVP